MEVLIKDSDLKAAAAGGMDAFVRLVSGRILDAVGGQLTAENMGQLTADQITLLAYETFRSEVMDGGFVQLIHNGYGPFIFLNPFAKAMNQWGEREFRNLVYDGRRLYEKYAKELERDCTDEEFMALFEQYPEFDDLDDRFVEMEEEVTELVARYVDEHLENFVVVAAS